MSVDGVFNLELCSFMEGFSGPCMRSKNETSPTQNYRLIPLDIGKNFVNVQVSLTFNEVLKRVPCVTFLGCYLSLCKLRSETNLTNARFTCIRAVEISVVDTKQSMSE